MNIYNLDQASQEMANIIWNAESIEEVNLFIDTLDMEEARMAQHIVDTMLIGGDDVSNLSDASETISRIMAL
jgi:hypothetical protein